MGPAGCPEDWSTATLAKILSMVEQREADLAAVNDQIAIAEGQVREVREDRDRLTAGLAAATSDHGLDREPWATKLTRQETDVLNRLAAQVAASVPRSDFTTA
jgi:hypothetical protein